MNNGPPVTTRQPLQTYLNSSVRPPTSAAAGAAPAPAASDVFSNTHSSSHLFNGPTTTLGADHLSSLLGNSPSSTPRTSVFRDNNQEYSSAAGMYAPVVGGGGASNQQGTVTNNLLSPGVNTSVALTPAPSTFTSPVARLDLPSMPGSTVTSPMPITAARPLEQTTSHDHPLGFGGGSFPLVSAPMARQASLGAPNSSSVGGSGVIANPLLQPKIQRSTSTPQPVTSPQSPPPTTTAGGGDDPTASPDEKLSVLMSDFFQSPPPVPKLAGFDVSAVGMNEGGVRTLAEKGCWREVIRVCEILLKGWNAGNGTSILNTTNTQPAPPTIPVVFRDDDSTNTTLTATSAPPLKPHEAYRLVHLHLSALVKLRKYEQAHALLQAKAGNLYGQDKLYSSHPEIYSAAKNQQTAGETNDTNATAATATEQPQQQQYIGNMIPFELHLLSTELSHYLGRTRVALDQQMKLLHFIKLQIQRKKNGDSANSNAHFQERRPSLLSPKNNEQERRPSLTIATPASAEGQPAGIVSALTQGGTLGNSSNNPISLHSSHTLSPLTLPQLETQLNLLRVHISNLCLSFSPLDVDYSQAREWLVEANESSSQPTLYEALARISLQEGDVAQATAYSEQAKKMYEANGDAENFKIGLQQVFLHLARNDYTAAHSLISTLHTSHPDEIDVVNNYAVCCLYVNDIKTGVAALEALIRKDPIRNLHPSVVSNLRALYDISSSNPAQKRRLLEGLILMYGEDDLDLAP